MAILRAARTSTGLGLKSIKEDRTTLRYLMRHAHTTPFEMVEFTWHHVLPIFVARQLIRTRTANVNEYSLRYSEAQDRFWFPATGDLRKQGTANKQGGDEPMDLQAAEAYINNLHHQSEQGMSDYQQAIQSGVSRELARVGLPVNLYTEWYWKIDLHNLLRTLSLRLDSHAQKEIRDYAEAMYQMVQIVCPVATEAFDDYDARRGALTLSRLDLAALGNVNLDEIFTNDRELLEHRDKLDRMHLPTTHADILLERRKAAKA
jgi:thymidylate synthase (FAD)